MINHAKPIFKSMNVAGTRISATTFQLAYYELRRRRAFRFIDARLDLLRVGVPKYDRIDRVADRWLQDLRKQGLIAYGKEIPGRWGWVR